jgi:hypothetical protein
MIISDLKASLVADGGPSCNGHDGRNTMAFALSFDDAAPAGLRSQLIEAYSPLSPRATSGRHIGGGRSKCSALGRSGLSPWAQGHSSTSRESRRDQD